MTIDSAEYKLIDFILNKLKDTQAMIIDVRSNGGGNSAYADLIAQRFNDSTRLFLKYRTRQGPEHNDFTEWQDIYIDACDGIAYNKPVAVLTNRRCFSSAEWFIASMDVIPGITIVGDTTGGGSGNPLIRELPNGWVMRVSSSQKQRPNGKDYQYTGISPDIPVWISKEDSINGIDGILETAIDYLNK